AKVHEPLRVAGVVATRAHADRHARVRHRPPLVAEILRVRDLRARVGPPALYYEVVLDAVPGQPVVVARPSERENTGRGDRRDVTAQTDGKRTTSTGTR